MKILICGSYFPKEEYDKLIEIRDELRKKGWKKASLVRDIKYPPKKTRALVTSREKSFNAIDDADIVFFIFTKGGQSDGRGMEIEHVLGNSFLLWKTILIFEEEIDGRKYGSDLILDELKMIDDEINIAYVKVNDNKEMIETIESQLVNFLESLPRAVPKDSSM